MSEHYDFHYQPTGSGAISGQQVLQQTEDAINELGDYVNDNVGGAMDVAQQALETAQNAEQDAQTALDTANSFSSAIQSAQQDASTALSTAQTAQTTASNANNIAIQASQDASSAVTTANNASGQVSTLSGTVTTLGQRVTTAEGNIGQNTSDITALTTRVGTAEGNITTLQNDVSIAQGNASSAMATAGAVKQQAYVFRYSSTALVASSTNSNTLLDNTDNLKIGDKVIDSSGVLFSITAIDTANSTFTIGTALIDLLSSSDVGAAALSNNYNDLDNLPTIPTVNDATLTIQKNGTNVATFTSNSNTDVTANITVPTKTSELTNDSGFLTSHQSLSSCVKNVVTSNQFIKSTGITRGTAPSSAQTFGIAFSDNNNKYIGNIYGQFATDKSTYVGLYAYNGTTTSNGDNAYVRIGYDASGNVFTSAPTPATADNSTQIATTAFVKAQGYLTSHQSLANYVTTNTAQTISGNKTFSSINGVEPSSLSLPSDRSARIDISSYFTNIGSGNRNDYSVPANGFIFLNLLNAFAVVCYSIDGTNNVNYAQSYFRTVDGQIYILFPVRKNDTFRTLWTANGGTITVTDAHFIPCQGNV